MEEYPFKHIEHQVYKNSLLEETQVAFVFASAEEDLLVPPSAEEGFPLFFNRFFKLKHSLDEYLSKDGITISNKDLGIGYEFGTKYTLLRFGRKKYHSFLESVPQFLLPMKWFVFKTLEKQDVKNLLVRKINVMPFRIDDLKVFKEKPEIVLGAVFKKQFLDLKVTKSESDVPGALFDVADREIRFGHYVLLLRMGIASPKSGDDRYYVIFDMAIQNDAHEAIDEGKIDSSLLAMNDILFDAFHWCVSDVIIDMMEKGGLADEQFTES